MEQFNVLSVCDGMSCGQIALQELNIKVDNYFASEIDKSAIKVTRHNFPNTIHIGDIKTVDISTMPKIDLLIGGTPCTDFSIAGKMNGMHEITDLEQYLNLKSQGFQFSGQSYLFWEYVRILRDIRETNPKAIFMLENVMMKKVWEVVISHALNINSIMLDAALVSAQNRKRLFWSNIKTEKQGLFNNEVSVIPQPEDRGILLRDILEAEVDKKYYLSKKIMESFIRNTEKQKENGNGFKFEVLNLNNKSKTVTTLEGRRMENNFVLGADIRTYEGLRIRTDFKSPTLDLRNDGKRSKMVIQLNKTNGDSNIRRLTPTECRRLQSVPEWYDMSIVSETQRYKLLGNGWNVEIIKHILNQINK